MSRGGACAVALLAVSLTACGRAPAPPPAATAPSPASVATLRAEGDRLAERDDWAGAVRRYREALQLAPDDYRTRFALGVALSRLDDVRGAVEQFRWVVERGGPHVERGAPQREEVEIARRWLHQAEPLPDAQPPARPAAVKAAAEPARSPGTVRGRTAWSGASADDFGLTLQILLEGDEPSIQGKLLGARTRLGEPYAIEKVPAGSYRLSAQVGAVRLWETTARVRAGEATVVDLTPDTSLVSPAEFPAR